MNSGKVLAIDYGTKNIGLACCDEMHVAIRPLPSLIYRSYKNLLAQIQQIVKENQIEAIVVGMPLNMDGSEGSSAEKVQRFMIQLRKNISIPLHAFDERLSTEEALDIWRDFTSRQKQKYRTVDSLAAALILKRYLNE